MTPCLELTERRAWARREGFPLWLWPEVERNNWRQASRSIAAVAAAKLQNETPTALVGNRAALRLASYTSGMAPLLGWWIEAGELTGVDPALDAHFRRQLQVNRARSSMLRRRTIELATMFAESGAAVLVLKGMHSGSVLFPEPGCRPMSDIDLLVAKPDVARAEEHLVALGFVKFASRALESSWRDGSARTEPADLTALSCDDPWAVDLHHSLDVVGPPGSARACLSRGFDPSACLPWPDHPWALCLPQPLFLLHLAAHAGSSFPNLTPVRLVEIVLAARAGSQNGSLNWAEWLETGRRCNALGFAYPAIKLAHDLSPQDIPEEIVSQCASAAPRAIRDIVDKLTPGLAQGIDEVSVGRHFAWTSGASGWARRLASDLMPEPDSLRQSALTHWFRARSALSGKWRW